MPVTDFDLAWHIHQTALDLLFAQGLAGLLLSCLLLWLALKQTKTAARAAGDSSAVALLAGLSGLTAVAALGSVMDTGRIALMAYAACFVGVLVVQAIPSVAGKMDR